MIATFFRTTDGGDSGYLHFCSASHLVFHSTRRPRHQQSCPSGHCALESWTTSTRTDASAFWAPFVVMQKAMKHRGVNPPAIPLINTSVGMFQDWPIDLRIFNEELSHYKRLITQDAQSKLHVQPERLRAVQTISESRFQGALKQEEAQQTRFMSPWVAIWVGERREASHQSIIRITRPSLMH